MLYVEFNPGLGLSIKAQPNVGTSAMLRSKRTPVRISQPFPEPSFPYLDALAPFQPLMMKAVHCPIDTR